jgi:hypothetical protein
MSAGSAAATAFPNEVHKTKRDNAFPKIRLVTRSSFRTTKDLFPILRGDQVNSLIVIEKELGAQSLQSPSLSPVVTSILQVAISSLKVR